MLETTGSESFRVALKSYILPSVSHWLFEGQTRRTWSCATLRLPALRAIEVENPTEEFLDKPATWRRRSDLASIFGSEIDVGVVGGHKASQTEMHVVYVLLPDRVYRSLQYEP